MIIKTAELEGNALNWAVAKAIGSKQLYISHEGSIQINGAENFTPARNWTQGGDIIQQNGIDLHQIKQKPNQLIEARHFDASKGDVIEHVALYKRDMVRRPNPPRVNDNKWLARMSEDNHPFGWKKEDFLSDTPLEAAMRCFVSYKLGAEIDVPDALAPRKPSQKRTGP